jgi:hypothetical protein
MIFDLTQNIYNIDGKIARTIYSKTKEGTKEGEEDEVVEESVKMTLGLIIRDCALYQLIDIIPDEKEHLFRYSIYEKVKDVDNVELNQDEIDSIKLWVSKRYTPIWAGQILRMLNNGK